jgi:hypothetical protein
VSIEAFDGERWVRACHCGRSVPVNAYCECVSDVENVSGAIVSPQLHRLRREGG